jgi:predicted transcriptional regulator
MSDVNEEPMSDETIDRSEVLGLTAQIVSAYVENNRAEPQQVTELLETVFGTLSTLSKNDATSEIDLVPAVPVKKSVTADYLICLEDGKKLKMLKRHLLTSFGMTPDEYRAKWGLPRDYPMVASNYTLRRRELAIGFGLGRSKTAEMTTPEPEPAPKPRTRRKAA